MINDHASQPVQTAAKRTRTALFPGVPLVVRGKAAPFLKWAGGKTELLPEIEKRLPRSFGTYWEPFIGGGALYFRLSPVSAVISDANEELVNCYNVVRERVDELIASLRKHTNEKEYFLRVRKLQPWQMTPVQRASRLIFLNKTCYNGLYRVNQRGEFNVPFGRYENPRICDEEGLRDCSRVLKGAEILCRDFRHLLYKARPDDFVYFDPPYSPVSKTSSFTSYSESPFEEREQRALKQVFSALSERGCHVMLSNSDTELTRKLYHKFRIADVQASRAINCDAEKRGKISELIITNY